MSVKDSKSRCFDLNISLTVAQAHVAPTSGQGFFFVLYCIRRFFTVIHTHSARYKNVIADNWNINFLRGKNVSIGIGLICWKCAGKLVFSGNICTFFFQIKIYWHDTTEKQGVPSPWLGVYCTRQSNPRLNRAINLIIVAHEKRTS